MRKSGDICIYKDGREYLFDGIAYHDLKSRRCKECFCALFIKNDELYTHSFTLPISTDEENFLSVVEMTLYENGKLDPQRSYRIDYRRVLSEKGDVWVVDAFAADIEQMERNYYPLYKKFGYIDLIAVPYLAHEAYLKRNIELAGGVLLVIHIGREDSFVSLFKNGDFIGYNKIYSLEFMARKISMDIDEISEILTDKGVEEALYDDSEKEIVSSLVPMFIDMVRQVERLVRNKKIHFDINIVEKVILDFGGQEIPGLWKLMDEYGFKTHNRELIGYEIEKGIPCVDVFDCIMDIYLLEAYRGTVEAPNLSPFRREPQFYRTWVGRLAISSILALLLVLAAGFYGMGEVESMSSRKRALENRFSNLEKSRKRLLESIKKEKRARAEAKRRLADIRRDIARFKEAMKMLGDIKEDAARRQQTLKDVDMVLERYAIMCKEMEQNGSKSMRVDLVVPFEERERIASFMKDIKAKGYRSVETDLVLLEGNLYHSEVRIER